MADRKISDLTALTTPASGDFLPIVDISEAAAATKNKRVTIQSLFQGIPVNVGIGTSTPRGQVSISNNAAGTGVVDSSLHFGYSVVDYYGFRIVNSNEPSDLAAGLFKFQRGTTAGWENALVINNSGNVGIGTAAPVTTLQVGPGNTTSNTARALFNTNDVAGRAGVAISNWTGSATTNGPRIFFDNSTRGAFEVGGADGTHAFVFVDQQAPAERMRIDSSGRVGIGTSSPATTSALEVSGNQRYLAITANAGAGGPTNPAVSSGLHLSWNRSNGEGESNIIYGTGAGGAPGLAIGSWNGTTYAERVRIDSSGNVGIGVNSPNTRLHVFGGDLKIQKSSINLSDVSEITLSNTYRTGRILSSYTNPASIAETYIAFHTNRTGQANDTVGETMRIAGGNVGIGTSAPTAKLHVETISAAANQSGSVLFGPDTSYGFEIRNAIDGSGFPRVELRAPTAGNGPILFFAGGSTERMRIDSNGDVAIGTTTSLARLTLEKAFAGGTAIDTNTTTASTTYSAAAFRHNGTVSGSIAVSTTATSYLTSSDYRLKENVTAVTDGITRLQQLKPSRFNFIADPDHTVDGFIAHEVQDVVPEAITGEKDAVDDDGNFVYQGIDQSKLVPLLTAALQEAIGRIEILEAEVSALKGA